MAANGRVRPDVVSVNGKEERHSEDAYYISWYEGKKLVRKSVGKEAQDAAFQQSTLPPESLVWNSLSLLGSIGPDYPPVFYNPGRP
jgi:hypothetical protein